MRRNTVILISLILLLLIGGGGVAYFRERQQPSIAFAEVDRFLTDARFLKGLPADRAWTLSNTKQETFTDPAPSGWLSGSGSGKEMQRTKYAFKDSSGKLVIILLEREGPRIVRFLVIGAPADEEEFRQILLEKFPLLEVVRQTSHS